MHIFFKEEDELSKKSVCKDSLRTVPGGEAGEGKF